MSMLKLVFSLITLSAVHRFALAQAGFSSLSSSCVSFIRQYPPTVSLYASEICRVCTSLSLSPDVNACCATGNPTACFASSFYGVTVSDATISAPLNIPTVNSQLSSLLLSSTNCDSVSSIVFRCKASTPNLEDLCFHDQQSCLCSTAGTWAPSFYDNYYSLCLAFVSTADPSLYYQLGPNENGVVQSRPCQTWAQFTATGGTPSDCATSPSIILSSVSLASARPTSIIPTGAAIEIADMQAGNFVIVVITVVHICLVI